MQSGPREYDIINHRPLGIAKSSSTPSFRISHTTASQAHSRNGNKRNEESHKLHPHKEETVKNFDRQIVSKTFWSERQQEAEAKKTTFNMSSVNFDFLGNTQVRGPTQTVQDLKGKAFPAHRRKVIAEIYDISRLFAPKYNPDYRSLYKEDPLCFHHVKGPFSYFMDDAKRTGRVSRPQFKFPRQGQKTMSGVTNN